MEKHLAIAHSFNERYKKTFSKDSRYIISGCSNIEIQEIEQKYNIKLPKSYYVFLSEFGKSSPSLLGDFYMEYPHPLTQTEEFMKILLSQDEEEPSWIPPVQVPENLFVFANYYFEKIWFFIADGSSDDPPIFIADSAQGSGDVFKFKKVGESIWEFVENCIKDRESQ
jgi:hypothetical protein